MNRLRAAIHILLYGPEPPSAVGSTPATDSAPPRTTPPRDDNGPTEATVRLIALRDQIELAAESGGDSARLRNIARQLGDILQLDQVVSFEDDGSFDESRQQVVDTVATKIADEDYRIATTVRCGYLRDGALLRRQDVVLYRVADTPAEREAQ